MTDEKDVPLEDAQQGFLEYMEAVTRGELPARHECRGACNTKQFHPGLFARLSIDLGTKDPDWEGILHRLRPLFELAIEQLEAFVYCIAWTLQGPKRDRTYVRVTMAFLTDETSQIAAAAFFRGEAKHPDHGSCAGLIGEVIANKGVLPGSQDITNQEL